MWFASSPYQNRKQKTCCFGNIEILKAREWISQHTYAAINFRFKIFHGEKKFQANGNIV